jgi:hypothetical protein
LRGQIEFSAKASDQLFWGPFEVADLVHSILFGEVTKKERDELGIAKFKYTIIGPSLGGERIYSYGKIRKRDKHEYFIITFHEAD